MATINETITFSAILGLVILMIGSNARAESGFIASTNTTSGGISASTDPNYNIYQNLGLGFSMKYLKNMTVSEKTDNSTVAHTVHTVYFVSPHIPHANIDGYKMPHLTSAIVIVSDTSGPLGLPITLDDAVNQIILGAVNSNGTIISKTKGSLNGLPAYRVEDVLLYNPVNYTATTTKIPLHVTGYLTFRGGLFYVLYFSTYDKQQTDFLPIVMKMVDSFSYK